jgi:CubicO group peptidase (beta-lactamase class C family)
MPEQQGSSMVSIEHARGEGVRDSPGKRGVLLAATLILGAGTVAWLVARLFSTGRPADPNQDLQRILSEFVQKDRAVRNCVLSVMTGDGSLEWSGAAGIAHEDRPGPMAADTPIYIASITKLYTATVVMLLMEQGAVALDDPVAKYLPQELIHGIHVYNGQDYSAEITIQELLAHRSGIADYYTDKSRDGRNLFDLLVEKPDQPWTVDETIARAARDLKPHFPPGTDTSYSDTNFQLLGKVIEAVSGRPLDVVYEDLLFRPLGLEHTWLIGHWKSPALPAPFPADVFYRDRNITRARSNSAYWADGGIVSTAKEMNQFLRSLKQGRIVRSASLKLMHDWHRLQGPLQYGFGTMYFKLPGPITAMTGIPPLWGHSGSTGSFLYYSEDLDLYLAGSIDQTESKIKPFGLMRKAIRAIARWRVPSKTEGR